MGYMYSPQAISAWVNISVKITSKLGQGIKAENMQLTPV